MRRLEYLIHHAGTALVALVSLTTRPHGFCLYCVAFYMGVSEVSSIPLAIMELFDKNAGLAEKYAGINAVCRAIFAVLFVSFRCLYWPWVSLDQFKSVLSSKVPRALSSSVLIGGIGFMSLQLYWGSLIAKEVMKMLA
mmetsp:Transcript_68267/g.128926  ORF Transcript_68267/g.128926 Transcript_68267/m.128926 type:complete len:138 (+) Transcript_68267:3-416(+)